MSDEELLACGHTIDSVWKTLDAAPTEHQRTCEYCAEARSRLQTLHRMTRDARAKDQDLELRPETKNRIMSFARTHVRRGADVPVHHDNRSTVSFSQWVIARTVRDYIDSQPGLIARRCRVRVTDEGADRGLVPLTVELGLVISAATPFRAVENDIRAGVIRAVADKLGAIVAEVNLIVEDVHND